MTKPIQTSSHDSSSESEIITDQARIARLLEQLARRYTPLTVRIPGHDEHYTSCAVGVERPYVLLDELMPNTGHLLLLKERKLRVSGRLDGIDMRFAVSLARVNKKDNVLTYYMKLPSQLEYRQRRQAYRVRVPMATKLHVYIDINDGRVIEGELHDLSRSGTGTIVSDTDTIVETGLLCECAFELPDEVWLYCSVELRYAKSVGSKRHQHIGARFIDLSPAQTRLIGRCISELEREFIRKRAT